MADTLSRCPNEHRILVSFAVGDRDELMYLRYSCEDPTCDWCIVELGPDECKEIERITDSLLTHEVYNSKDQSPGGSHARTIKTDQPSLFSNQLPEDL